MKNILFLRLEKFNFKFETILDYLSNNSLIVNMSENVPRVISKIHYGVTEKMPHIDADGLATAQAVCPLFKPNRPR